MRLSRTRPVHAVSVTLMIADGFTGSMSKSQNMRIHGRGIRIFRHVGGRIGGGLRTIGIRITGMRPESETHCIPLSSPITVVGWMRIGMNQTYISGVDAGIARIGRLPYCYCLLFLDCIAYLLLRHADSHVIVDLSTLKSSVRLPHMGESNIRTKEQNKNEKEPKP